LNYATLVSSAPCDPRGDDAKQCESNAEGEQYGVDSRHAIQASC
jgi:hypothetical protein